MAYPVVALALQVMVHYRFVFMIEMMNIDREHQRLEKTLDHERVKNCCRPFFCRKSPPMIVRTSMAAIC